METAIGVFDSRDRAEEALKGLIERHVPQDSIVFLTRSENEAKSVGKELGAYVGGFTGGAAGMSAGVLAATLLVPGLGAVFALGFGAAALLGLAGAGTGAAVGKAMSQDSGVPQPTPDEKCSDDVVFFRKVLSEGRSLLVVRTESHEIATAASGILDRLGIGMQERTNVKMQVATRQTDGITILDVSGRITVGEGNVILREIVRDLVDKGRKQILLNLYEVDYVDSSGLGELVRIHTTLRKAGGQMKLVSLSKRVQDLLQMTSMNAVFDIQKNEASAIKSFDQAAGAIA
jgi:anti-sigma B factor antagonist